MATAKTTNDRTGKSIRAIRNTSDTSAWSLDPLEGIGVERARSAGSPRKAAPRSDHSSRAALQLEANGSQGSKPQTGACLERSEVRFYSSESLAYLDEPAWPKSSPRLRARAGVSGVRPCRTQRDGRLRFQGPLQQLLNVPSAETRYGAFRSLTPAITRPLVRGAARRTVQFRLLPLPVPDVPHRPEPGDQRLSSSAMTRSRIAQRRGGQPHHDQHLPLAQSPSQVCRRRTRSATVDPPRVDEVIPAIVELAAPIRCRPGCRRQGGRRPATGLRSTHCHSGQDLERLVKSTGGNDEAPGRATSPIPDLFSSSLGGEEGSSAERAEESAGAVEGAVSADSAKKPKRSWSLFDRIRGRDRS